MAILFPHSALTVGFPLRVIALSTISSCRSVARCTISKATLRGSNLSKRYEFSLPESRVSAVRRRLPGDLSACIDAELRMSSPEVARSWKVASTCSRSDWMPANRRLKVAVSLMGNLRFGHLLSILLCLDYSTLYPLPGQRLYIRGFI